MWGRFWPFLILVCISKHYQNCQFKFSGLHCHCLGIGPGAREEGRSRVGYALWASLPRDGGGRTALVQSAYAGAVPDRLCRLHNHFMGQGFQAAPIIPRPYWQRPRHSFPVRAPFFVGSRGCHHPIVEPCHWRQSSHLRCQAPAVFVSFAKTHFFL